MVQTVTDNLLEEFNGIPFEFFNGVKRTFYMRFYTKNLQIQHLTTLKYVLDVK
jgi:hypothetical protein